jgi:hypothetical protein
MFWINKSDNESVFYQSYDIENVRLSNLCIILLIHCFEVLLYGMNRYKATQSEFIK